MSYNLSDESIETMTCRCEGYTEFDTGAFVRQYECELCESERRADALEAAGHVYAAKLLRHCLDCAGNPLEEAMTA